MFRRTEKPHGLLAALPVAAVLVGVLAGLATARILAGPVDGPVAQPLSGDGLNETVIYKTSTERWPPLIGQNVTRTLHDTTPSKDAACEWGICQDV